MQGSDFFQCLEIKYERAYQNMCCLLDLRPISIWCSVVFTPFSYTHFLFLSLESAFC